MFLVKKILRKKPKSTGDNLIPHKKKFLIKKAMHVSGCEFLNTSEF